MKKKSIKSKLDTAFRQKLSEMVKINVPAPEASLPISWWAGCSRDYTRHLFTTKTRRTPSKCFIGSACGKTSASRSHRHWYVCNILTQRAATLSLLNLIRQLTITITDLIRTNSHNYYSADTRENRTGAVDLKRNSIEWKSGVVSVRAVKVDGHFR